MPSKKKFIFFKYINLLDEMKNNLRKLPDLARILHNKKLKLAFFAESILTLFWIFVETPFDLKKIFSFFRK